MRIARCPAPSVGVLHWLRKQASSAITPKYLSELCRIVLLSAEGKKHEQIAAALGISRQKASRWREGVVESGRAALENDAPGRGRKAVYGASMQAFIVEKSLRSLPPEATQWSQRSVAFRSGA